MTNQFWAIPVPMITTTPEHSQDLKELRALQEHLLHLSRHDQDTGLLNHDALLNAMDNELAKPAGQSSSAAFIEIRIGGLSSIGDVYGRKTIGSVIRQIADRLVQSPVKDRIIGRIDHKSFGIFLTQVSDPLVALQTAKQFIAVCTQPLLWGDVKLNVEAVAGVALTSETAGDSATLLHHASLAIRESDENGGPGYSFFNPESAEAAKRRNDLIAIITKAVDQKLFTLAYQPFFDLDNGALLGFEALMRLNLAETGVIHPGEFILIAEEIGLISKLGAWAVEEACSTAARWPSHLIVAVNFSAAQFHTGTLLAEVNLALERTGFAAYRLEVEITEGTILKNQELVLAQLNSLRDMGCSIALDDFGTGYSSLSYLWQFPFSKLKIDRSFIHALDSTPKAPGILRSIMDLSKNLGLKVTAEGIETVEQMRVLRNLHCDYVQGFLFGRPAVGADVDTIILKNYSEPLRAEAPEDLTAKANLHKAKIIR